MNEVKISEEKRKEMHDILEEMESGKEYRLEDVLTEILDIKERLKKVENRIPI